MGEEVEVCWVGAPCGFREAVSLDPCPEGSAGLGSLLCNEVCQVSAASLWGFPAQAPLLQTYDPPCCQMGCQGGLGLWCWAWFVGGLSDADAGCLSLKSGNSLGRKGRGEPGLFQH